MKEQKVYIFNQETTIKKLLLKKVYIFNQEKKIVKLGFSWD